jgi:three-Cys-motif partner protein
MGLSGRAALSRPNASSFGGCRVAVVATTPEKAALDQRGWSVCLPDELGASEESIDIQIRPGDANVEIQELCKKDWSSHRAVLFLDPYGMQVEWKTIEAIAATKAIDLWLLFPLGIGVNRLLTKGVQ